MKLGFSQRVSKNLWVYGGALVIAVAGFFIVSNVLNAQSGEVLVDSQEYWEERIEKVGSKDAHEELLEATASFDPSKGHGVAHIFGSALYIKDVEEGFLVCDSNLSYGCLHEFIGRSISDKGLETILEINELCDQRENSGGCQHGIGHGLLGFLGYEESSFEKAVAACQTLPNADAFVGCQAGVFMEYNLQSIAVAEEVGTLRPLVDDNWYAPCSSLSGDTRKGCVLWQPQWWWELMVKENLSVEEVAIRGFELCQNGDSQDRDFCFAGAGQMIPSAANFDTKTIQSLCDSSVQNNQGQLICRAFSANVLFNTGDPIKAQEVCSDMQGEALKYCMAYANGNARVQTLASDKIPTK